MGLLLQFAQRTITDPVVFNLASRPKIQPIDESQTNQRAAETGQDEIDEARHARKYFNF